jgi:hypothetical protein
VNWIVWPFVARHELRKSLSSMLLNLGICYRGVVAKYIYHELHQEPTADAIRMSEIQEEKLREGCFRMRELAEMTRHEIVTLLFSSSLLRIFSYTFPAHPRAL